MNLTQLYFMPGLGASSKIFEYLNLPTDNYCCHHLEWLTPVAVNEPISDYAQRLCQSITEKNPVLIGVSFGGIMVQEMTRFLNAKAVIIISSVKSEAEFPKKFGVAKTTQIYKLFPSRHFEQIGGFVKENFGNKLKKQIELYEKYQIKLTPIYLDWAFETILNWKKQKEVANLHHIHGDADAIFPPKYITNFIPIKGGTHIMILNKAKEISNIIQEII
ncbi:MAG: alpha/beta hydrolase [Flavobacteriales bacterium CG03_land_8_20_14_0_80_35_15]|nr:MAG: alpha/beta hydrolase [Flavobacteriales bacterium CG03_land_8_20_14_0_80_35_15]PIX07401.1 MAG: alpha/beta hydrolase [Flavobacteriales bacterium CG_4_8_14_3_um_filter_35_10]